MSNSNQSLERLSNKLQGQKHGGGGFADQAANAGVALGHTMQQTNIGGVMSVGILQGRDLDQVEARVKKEAELSGESLVYQWTTNNKDGGKGMVRGLSIDAAMMLARNYGNCTTLAELSSESPTHWTFLGYFLDRETGFVSMRLFRQRKDTGLGGRMDADRKEDIAFQIGQSKAVRNAALRGIPEGLKVIAEETALDASAKKLTSGGKQAGIDKVTAAFKRYGVEPRHLEAKLGKKVKTWADRDIAELRAIYLAIQEGQTNAENEFDLAQDRKESVGDAVEHVAEPSPPEAKKAETKAKAETKKAETKAKAETEVEKAEPPPKDMAKEIGKVERAFARYETTMEQLESYIEKPRDQWEGAELTVLSELFKKIQKGEVTAKDALGIADEAPETVGSFDGGE